MFDDRDGSGPRGIELRNELECRIGVVDVIVGELLALHLPFGRDPAATLSRRVECGGLMRIFAIAQARSKLAGERAISWRGKPHFRREPIRDHRVIDGGARKCFLREFLAQFPGRATTVRSQFAEDLGVIAGVHDDRDVAVILGGGTNHSRAADVDIFDAIGETGAPPDRRLERIEIHHEKIDRRDAMRQHRRHMFWIFPYGQKPAMDLRMQSFHPSVKEFGKPGQIGDIADRQTSIGKHLARAAG